MLARRQVLRHAPPEIKGLADGNGLLIWISICAMLHLEQCSEGWAEPSPAVASNAEVPPEELAQGGLIAALVRLGPISAGVGATGGRGSREEDAKRALQLLQVRAHRAVIALNL